MAITECPFLSNLHCDGSRLFAHDKKNYLSGSHNILGRNVPDKCLCCPFPPSLYALQKVIPGGIPSYLHNFAAIATHHNSLCNPSPITGPGAEISYTAIQIQSLWNQTNGMMLPQTVGSLARYPTLLIYYQQLMDIINSRVKQIYFPNIIARGTKLSFLN